MSATRRPESEFLSDAVVAEFLFSRGSVALRAALKSLGVGEGDTVILTGFTCVVVAEAVKQVGATCRYIDMNKADFGTSATALSALDISQRPKAVIVQHSFGIPADMDPIMQWADESGVPIIEDCAISLGSSYKGRPIGSFGAASFWSGQWSKPIPVGRLGILHINDESMVSRVHDLWQNAKPASPGEQLIMACQTPVRRSVLSSRQKAYLQALSRKARRAKEEQNSGVQQFDLDMRKGGHLQYRLWRRALRNWHRQIAHRDRIAAIYRQELGPLGFVCHVPESDRQVIYGRFPLRVRNKKVVLQQAEVAAVEIGEWMDSPLHEAREDLRRWDYEAGCCPEGERAAEETINLPVHTRVSVREAARVTDFVSRIAEPATEL